MRILLLGATGQVGWELQRTLSVLGDLVVTSRRGPTGLHLDTQDLAQLQATLDSVAPDVIVNATAYTAVDKAESEPELAMRLNAEVPGLIGAWAAAHDALVIHYSTDYVFDGTKDGPYVESDPPNPLNVYGRTKLAGDQALLASGCAAVILRVSWVYGLRGHNFLLTMVRLMQEREELRIVDDQIGAPTWCRTIAQATSVVLARLPRDREARRGLCGVYHVSPSGSTSWFGFAQAIRDGLALGCTLRPIPACEYPTPAQRPMNSRMDASRLQQVFGLSMSSWEADLGLCLGERC
jgi:dTDP-4-dehydrorhamnose reductase